MGEIILMPDPLLGLHAFQGAKLGENQWQQSAFIQQVETDRGLWREDDLVQLVHDTLLGDDGERNGKEQINAKITRPITEPARGVST